MRIEVFRGQNGDWFLRLVAENGETVLVSEGYTRKWSARRAALKLRRRFGQIGDVIEVDA